MFFYLYITVIYVLRTGEVNYLIPLSGMQCTDIGNILNIAKRLQNYCFRTFERPHAENVSMIGLK